MFSVFDKFFASKDKKPKVIALLGRAGSGKSTVADHLELIYGASVISFAKNVKELASRLLDFEHKQLYGTQAEKEAVDPRYGFSARQFLQRVGNETREVVGDRVWLDALLNTVFESDSDLFVIDDCRYVNEAECIAKDDRIDGYVIKLECPDAPSTADPNHPSEREVDEVPAELITAKIVSKRSLLSIDLIRELNYAINKHQIL